MSQNGALMGFVHRRRRGAELFLLVLALMVGIGAYAAVGLGVEGTIPADMVAYGGWLTALIVGGVGVGNAVHAFVERKRPSIATLKSVGAPGSQVVALYLTQVMLIAGLGTPTALIAGLRALDDFMKPRLTSPTTSGTLL